MADRDRPLLLTDGCTIQFPGRAHPALSLGAMRIDAGERVLIAGATGSGKTTLWNLVAGLIDPACIVSLGSTAVLGDPVATLRPSDIGQHLGAVFQSPGDQVIATAVHEEIALGLRALEWDESGIAATVDEVLAQVGLASYSEHPPALLSGGQQQRLALAAAIARDPAWLLLDEPFSQLDPRGASELAALIATLTKERGMGLFIAEHRHALARGCVDRAIVLHEGLVQRDGPVGEVLAHFSASPLASRAARLVSDQLLIECRQLAVGYERHGPIVLTVDGVIPASGITVILGANGSGKSTLLALLAGELRPYQGALHWRTARPPRIAYVPQQSDFRLLGETIGADLRLSRATPKAIDDIATALRLPPLDTPPLAASRGERLRISLAGALLEQPDLLLLDEPTTGQDADALQRFATLLLGLAMPIVLATHDLALAAALASTVLILCEGRVLAAGPVALLQDQALLRSAGLWQDHDG